MELYCLESEKTPCALYDAAIVEDDRTLKNLIFTEEHYLITGSYFKCLQSDLTTNNRAELANWMLEVCEAEQCQSEVFPLAMNLLDRFLALVKLRKGQLQLLGSVCLFIASKLRQTQPITPQRLVFYTDWSITVEELTDWELLVLNKLKWDVAAVTPNDFVGPLLRRLAKKFPLINIHQNRITKHILNMIDLCSLDFNFSMYPPSMVASASIITAVDGLLTLTQDPYLSRTMSMQVLTRLHEMTGIEKELLRECHLQIEQKILRTMQGQDGIGSGDGGDDNCKSSSDMIMVVDDDCPKENHYPNNSCSRHNSNLFHKHNGTCIPTNNQTSIGVEY